MLEGHVSSVLGSQVPTFRWSPHNLIAIASNLITIASNNLYNSDGLQPNYILEDQQSMVEHHRTLYSKLTVLIPTAPSLVKEATITDTKRGEKMA